MPSAAATKNKLQTLDEPRAGHINIKYSPDGDDVAENPPRFTWLPVIETEAVYAVRFSTDPEFSDATTVLYTEIPLNFFTPDAPLAPGEYYWSYAVWSAEDKAPKTNWSKTRSFTVADDLPMSALVSRKDRYKNATLEHPRLWMTPDRLVDFKAAVKADPDHCKWSNFYEKSVLPWMDRDVMKEPAGYPNHQRTAPIWRQTYIDLQEHWYAIRHLAIGGYVTENQEMLDRAKEWLLEAASWDPMGVTSRAYTDEWAYRVTNGLSWGYDWLYNELTEDERATVRAALMERTRDIADHAIKHANIHLFPYDSHAVRSVSLTLVPACIALMTGEEDDEAREWLDYCIEFLFTVYTPWGDSDGGWAEGTHYWMMGIAYLIDAANRLKSYLDIDIYQRPFFQNTGDFPLFCKAPNTRRATFGDDSTQGDLVCIKTGLNMRQFGGATGNGEYQWYCEENLRLNPGTEMEFYNWGWWDTNFDELTFLTDFPTVEATPPKGGMRHFKGIGWVGIQHEMANPDEHIQFVMKSSQFGSISHSHGDQNAFCLAAFGEDLAVQSGYYVAFNSTMHQNWRKQTVSKNAILINGKGQYAGRDKSLQKKAVGNVLVAEEREDHIYIKGDATEAYKVVTPEVTNVTREYYFVNNKYFVIADSIDASEPVDIEWRLHANNPFDLGETSFRNTGEKAGFYGQVIWSESGSPSMSQTTGYPGVDPEELAGRPEGTFLSANFPKATRHRIVTLLVPYPKAEPRRIFHFLDDQGYDCDLYFTDADENTFKLVVKKLASTNI